MSRIFIADDHEIMREGLKRIILEQSAYEVCGDVGDSYNLVEQLIDSNAEVLVLDISMPGPGFIETMKRVSRALPSLSILVLSTHPEDMYAKRSFMLGASGYLTKNQSPDELVNAIEIILKGQKYVSQALAGNLLVSQGDDLQPPHELLSEREYQVLCMLGQGKSPSVIASELSISIKTVSTYRSRIITKMGLKSTIELVRYVVENNLVDL